MRKANTDAVVKFVEPVAFINGLRINKTNHNTDSSLYEELYTAFSCLFFMATVVQKHADMY